MLSTTLGKTMRVGAAYREKGMTLVFKIQRNVNFFIDRDDTMTIKHATGIMYLGCTRSSSYSALHSIDDGYFNAAYFNITDEQKKELIENDPLSINFIGQDFKVKNKKAIRKALTYFREKR